MHQINPIPLLVNVAIEYKGQLESPIFINACKSGIR